MSFQAYLDALEDKTGKTPRELLAVAAGRGYGPATPAGDIVTWLREDFGVGRGHAMPSSTSSSAARRSVIGTSAAPARTATTQRCCTWMARFAEPAPDPSPPATD